MTTNTKIRTEDVLEILDTKIKTSADHAQLDVVTGEFYDSVLSKIAARSPTLNEKNALDAGTSPSAVNPFVTLSELQTALIGAIPWRTIGPVGSGADYEGSDETPFLAAFATVPTHVWFYVKPGTYDFTTTVTVPDGVRLIGGLTSKTKLTSNLSTTLIVGDSTYISYLSVSTTLAGAMAMDASASIESEIRNCIVTSTSTGTTIDVTNAERLTISDTALMLGNLVGSGLVDSNLANLYIDASGNYGIDLDLPIDVIIWGSIFYAGTPRITAGTNIRVVGNHFNNGITNLFLTSVLISSLTDVNTGTDTFSYVGSPTIQTGWSVKVSTSDTLPDPLVASTTYYVVNPTVSNFQLSLTPDGLPIDITTTGIGNQTFILNPSILLRANTPSSNNNEDESLTYLLQYLGSPSSSQATPSYSSNFTGPQAQDLTARASAIDLCLQWIYEERNFSLISETEPLTVRWNPLTNTLTTDNNMLLVSAHRDAVWKLLAMSVVIPDGWYAYYIIDRTLNTSNITLTRYTAALGSIPIDTTPPTGSPNNRQIWILAYNLGGTLWWRGGGGSRFPSTGGFTGEYFVDGKSKSFLTYVGAIDYNDPHPAYSNNFAGIQGESLTTRLSKTDELLQRLFEHSNLSYYISTGGYFSSDATNNLTLTGTLTFKLPHIVGSTTVSAGSWTIPDGSLLYFTWDQETIGPATATVAATVPLPNAYPLTTKYFVAAIHVGSLIYLWDGTRLPMTGGRWPLPSPSRSVVPTAMPSTLLYNTVWTNVAGSMHFMWENLAVITSTGININRNTLVNQLVPSLGLTNLADGEGLVVTHTWNPGAAQNAAVQKVTLPLSSILEQNQFLWVQNRGGYLLFTGEF